MAPQQRRLATGARLLEDRARLVGLVVLVSLAGALWLTRAALTAPRLEWLAWNLGLAIVPWVLSLTLRFVGPAPIYWVLFGAWLSFFPNAPYLVTDLVHLRPHASLSPAFDVLMFSAFAFAGCALGWDSLSRVRRTLELRHGAALARGVAGLSIGLCGFGVFLGRFERLNSWQVVTAPASVLSTALDALSSPRALLYSACFGALFGAGYLFMSERGAEPRTSRP